MSARLASFDQKRTELTRSVSIIASIPASYPAWELYLGGCRPGDVSHSLI
jgi:hypothetical protein